MAGIKTGFLPGKDLFFTLRTQNELYKAYNVKTHREFMVNVLGKKSGSGGTGLEPDDYYNIFMYALKYDHKEITKEEVADLIDQWQIEGIRDQEDLDILMYEVFTNSGMYPKEAFETLKEFKISPEKMKEYLKKVSGINDEKGEDMGESQICLSETTSTEYKQSC